jgi:hypothetical protein
MSAPVRFASESAADFEARVEAHRVALSGGSDAPVLRDAAVVYAEGVAAGLSIALAATQRRERISDHLRRWEFAAANRGVRG